MNKHRGNWLMSVPLADADFKGGSGKGMEVVGMDYLYKNFFLKYISIFLLKITKIQRTKMTA